MDKRKKSCIIIIVIALIVTGFMAVYRATNTRSVKSESGWRIVVCKVSEGWEGFLVCDKTHTGSVGTVKADVTMGGEHLLYTDIKPEENVLGFAAELVKMLLTLLRQCMKLYLKAMFLKHHRQQ